MAPTLKSISVRQIKKVQRGQLKAVHEHLTSLSNEVTIDIGQGRDPTKVLRDQQNFMDLEDEIASKLENLRK